MLKELICCFCRKPILNKEDIYIYSKGSGENELWHKECASKQGFDTSFQQIISQDILDKHYKSIEENKRLMKVAELYEQMIIVSSPIFQGRTITKYFNVITSEVVLGSGFFTEADAFTSDIIGTRARGFEEKLIKAKEIAMNNIKDQAVNLGANGVVAVDIDYSVLNKNVLMVVVSGTPVIAE